MKARAVKTFPVGQDWMYEPKWDGFRCLIFRDEENIFLQSRTGKSLSSAFPEIVTAFQSVSLKSFVLDGELAMPTESGFSFDGLVNRLRLGSVRIAIEARDSPAIYITFDMLANSKNLLGSPFRLRHRILERFFENSVPRSLPLYLSASTEDLSAVEKWIGQEFLDLFFTGSRAVIVRMPNLGKRLQNFHVRPDTMKVSHFVNERLQPIPPFSQPLCEWRSGFH